MYISEPDKKEIGKRVSFDLVDGLPDEHYGKRHGGTDPHSDWRYDSIKSDEIRVTVDFKDKTYFDAGVGSTLFLTVRKKNQDKRLAEIQLQLSGRHINDPKFEGELAEKIREFVRELKALQEFATQPITQESQPLPA
jgi:hypothetical protein